MKEKKVICDICGADMTAMQYPGYIGSSYSGAQIEIKSEENFYMVPSNFDICSDCVRAAVDAIAKRSTKPEVQNFLQTLHTGKPVFEEES